MKRFLSLLMVLALLLACVPVHVHGEEHTSESEEVYFEDRQDAIDYIEKAISQRVSELHLKLPMEVYSSNILTSLYENAVTEETRWTVVLVDWDGTIEAGFIYLYYAFEYLTTAQQEEELNTAVEELLEQLDYNRFNRFACVKKVYDWACANITYVPNEEAELIDFTAYGAMINRKATSYGFAVLIKKGNGLLKPLLLALHFLNALLIGKALLKNRLNGSQLLLRVLVGGGLLAQLALQLSKALFFLTSQRGYFLCLGKKILCTDKQHIFLLAL